MSRSLSVVTLGTALWLLSASSLLADDPPVAKPPIRVGEAAIEEALLKPVALEFIETPLSDVIDSLKDQCKIEIQLDTRALTDVGIGCDTPVTKNLKGISLRSALNLMLRELNLTWTIQDEVLLITTPEEADCRLYVKVIDVSDLVVCRDKDGRLWDDYDTLIDIIIPTVKPTSWDEVGGPGSIAGASLGKGKVLIVAQTYEVHGEIMDLLAKIREVCKDSPNPEISCRDKSICRPKPPIGGGMGATDGKPQHNDVDSHSSTEKPAPGAGEQAEAE